MHHYTFCCKNINVMLFLTLVGCYITLDVSTIFPLHIPLKFYAYPHLTSKDLRKILELNYYELIFLIILDMFANFLYNALARYQTINTSMYLVFL